MAARGRSTIVNSKQLHYIKHFCGSMMANVIVCSQSLETVGGFILKSLSKAFRTPQLILNGYT